MSEDEASATIKTANFTAHIKTRHTIGDSTITLSPVWALQGTIAAASTVLPLTVNPAVVKANVGAEICPVASVVEQDGVV